MPAANVAQSIEMTQESLAQILDYEPLTGALKWKVRPAHMFDKEVSAAAWNGRHAGRAAGSKLHKQGGISYFQVGIGMRTVRAHRVIWILVYGAIDDSLVIDHVNGNGLDNRLVNIRLVSRAANSRNVAVGKRNTSGVVGVYWNAQKRKWRAQICLDGVQTFIGYYDEFSDAVEARKAREHQHDYHQLHGMNRDLRAASV